jgi:uncharacterized BrkB/YihY/UPF0761 family membrane protein
MKEKYWNVKMNRKKLFLIFLLILIPILVMSLHLISNDIIDAEKTQFMIDDILTREWFGIKVSLYLVYDIVLYLTIFITFICIMLFLMENRKRRKNKN